MVCSFYKTRNIADEIKKNRVSSGSNYRKSSKEVKEGDLIKIRKNQIDYVIKILEIPKSRVGAKLVPVYIQDKTDKEQHEILKQRKLAQDYYRIKGEGRPTKKTAENWMITSKATLLQLWRTVNGICFLAMLRNKLIFKKAL